MLKLIETWFLCRRRRRYERAIDGPWDPEASAKLDALNILLGI
jgi:hypothetical protein